MSYPRTLISLTRSAMLFGCSALFVLALKAEPLNPTGTIQRFEVEPNPEGLAFDGENIWAANYAATTVTKLRARDGSIVGVFTVGQGPLGLAFDGANIWVANSGSNTVTKLQASDRAVLGTFPEEILLLVLRLMAPTFGPRTSETIRLPNSAPATAQHWVLSVLGTIHTRWPLMA